MDKPYKWEVQTDRPFKWAVLTGRPFKWAVLTGKLYKWEIATSQCQAGFRYKCLELLSKIHSKKPSLLSCSLS
jgi:hypothetical protein